MKLNFKFLLLLVAFFTISFSFADEFQTATNSDSISSGLNGSGNGGTGGTGGTNGGTNGGTTGGTNGGTTGGTNGGTTGGTNGGTGGTGGTTGGNGDGCVRTQGFWGNSPAGEARLIELVGMSGMMLGTVNYTAAQLDDILDEPVAGNALINLAHQLIAAKLNVLNGADDSEIADEIIDADTLIANRVVPPVGADSVAPASMLGQQMTAVAGELDDYNMGDLNVPSCDSL